MFTVNKFVRSWYQEHDYMTQRNEERRIRI